MSIIFNLEPKLTAQLSPELVNGTSNKNAINLVCKAIVTEGVILASYQFTWMKNNDSLDSSDSRYMVCTCSTCVQLCILCNSNCVPFK